jgi:hypothetical protein
VFTAPQGRRTPPPAAVSMTLTLLRERKEAGR